MATLGLIATGAALLNYRKAKSDYDALIDKRDGLMAALNMITDAVDQYNEHKYDEQHLDASDHPSSIYTEDEQILQNDTLPDGLHVTTILRVGNLVGKLFYGKSSIVFINTGDTPVYVLSAQVDPSIFGDSLMMFEPGVKNLQNQKAADDIIIVNRKIQPGETIEIEGKRFVSVLEDMERLRQLICDAAGKRLITSCPKLNIEKGQASDMLIKWGGEAYKPEKQTVIMKMPGVLRYCGEAFYG